MRSLHIKKISLNFFVFILLVFLPSFALLSIPGIYQPLRFDFILMMLHVFLFFLNMAHFKKSNLFALAVIFFFFIYVLNSKSYLVGSFQYFGYISLLASFYLGKRLNLDSENDHSLSVLRRCFYFVIIVHIFGIFGFSISSTIGKEFYTFFGLYGTFGMPFKFGLVLMSVTLFLNEARFKDNYLFIILILFSAITSDSRISLVCFLIMLISIKPKIILLLIILLPLFTILGSDKILTLLDSSNISIVSSDSSLLMRLENIYSYINWIDIKKFFIGNGALSFLEYSNVYGAPGPVDMLPIRLFSEIGVPIFFLLFLIFFINTKVIFKTKLAYSGFIISIIFYSLFNEGLFALRSGNFFWFVVGYYIGKARLDNAAQVITK